MNNPNSI